MTVYIECHLILTPNPQQCVNVGVWLQSSPALGVLGRSVVTCCVLPGEQASTSAVQVLGQGGVWGRTALRGGHEATLWGGHEATLWVIDHPLSPICVGFCELCCALSAVDLLLTDGVIASVRAMILFQMPSCD